MTRNNQPVEPYRAIADAQKSIRIALVALRAAHLKESILSEDATALRNQARHAMRTAYLILQQSDRRSK